MNFIEKTSQWLSEPYSSNMSALKWVLFVGFILITLFAWQTVLARITE